MKKKITIDNKKYFLIFLILSLIVLSIISLINLNVDPENIYQKKLKFFIPKAKKEKTSEIIAELRLKKKFLIIKQKTWNEREFTNILLNYTKDIDCIVLGSSQVKTISVQQEPKSLANMCSSLINLGLSGASIEDYFSIFNKIRLKNIKNKKIIIGIHPWTLNFNRDSRWIYQKKDFYQYMSFILQEKEIFQDYNLENNIYLKALKNLINFQYLNASIKKIMYGNKNLIEFKNEIEINDKDFNNEILFYDGSSFLKKPKKKVFSNNFINYKIVENYYYDKDVVEILRKSIREINKYNEIIFLLTPYHPDVWQLKNEPIYKAMINTELTANKLAIEENIKIVGSFNPIILNCKKEEFHNLSHPSKWCLSKIDN